MSERKRSFTQVPTMSLDSFMSHEGIDDNDLKVMDVGVFAVLCRLSDRLTSKGSEWFYRTNAELMKDTRIKSEKTLKASIERLEESNWIQTDVRMPTTSRYKADHPIKHYRIMR